MVIAGIRTFAALFSISDPDLQSLPEPNPLNVKVGAHKLDLIGHRDPFPVRLPHRIAKYLSELLNGMLCNVRFIWDQGGDGVESVEQKVRIDSGTQSSQLRFGCIQQQLPLALLTPERIFALDLSF